MSENRYENSVTVESKVDGEALFGVTAFWKYDSNKTQAMELMQMASQMYDGLAKVVNTRAMREQGINPEEIRSTSAAGRQGD